MSDFYILKPISKYYGNKHEIRIHLQVPTEMNLDHDLFDGFIDPRRYSSLNVRSRGCMSITPTDGYYNRNVIIAPITKDHHSQGLSRPKRTRKKSIQNKASYPASDSDDSQPSENNSRIFNQNIPVFLYETYNKQNKYLPKATRKIYNCSKQKATRQTSAEFFTPPGPSKTTQDVAISVDKFRLSQTGDDFRVVPVTDQHHAASNSKDYRQCPSSKCSGTSISNKFRHRKHRVTLNSDNDDMQRASCSCQVAVKMSEKETNCGKLAQRVSKLEKKLQDEEKTNCCTSIEERMAEFEKKWKEKTMLNTTPHNSKFGETLEQTNHHMSRQEPQAKNKATKSKSSLDLHSDDDVIQEQDYSYLNFQDISPTNSPKAESSQLSIKCSSQICAHVSTCRFKPTSSKTSTSHSEKRSNPKTLHHHDDHIYTPNNSPRLSHNSKTHTCGKDCNKKSNKHKKAEHTRKPHENEHHEHDKPSMLATLKTMCCKISPETSSRQITHPPSGNQHKGMNDSTSYKSLTFQAMPPVTVTGNAQFAKCTSPGCTSKGGNSPSCVCYQAGRDSSQASSYRNYPSNKDASSKYYTTQYRSRSANYGSGYYSGTGPSGNRKSSSYDNKGYGYSSGYYGYSGDTTAAGEGPMYRCTSATCGSANKHSHEVGYATTIVTRFPNYTVYEVLRPSLKKPSSLSRVTENVFVVKNNVRSKPK